MPPKGNPRPSQAEVATIKKWIEAGAPGDQTGAAQTQHQLGLRAERARRVQFLLEWKCFQCHGRKEQQGGLDLRTRESMLKGGKSGPALLPGDGPRSLLVHKLAADQMPPRDLRYKLSIKPVTESELELIRQWINDGAPAPPPPPTFPENDALVSAADCDWWSIRPPRRPQVPQVKNSSRVRTPIDAFVLAKLEALGLTFSPEADSGTLLRRAYLDLTGLPPTPAQVNAFLKDADPAAYERVIDRLLAAPRYGERWGQHWLDAAGYADSEGALSTDPVYPDFYRYRDYVIRSHNADKPYDRFLLEQLAGDELTDYAGLPELTPEVADNLVATGFLRTGIDPTVSPETNFPSDRYQVLADTVEIVSSSLLGLTVRCARCHSHKYDPISQRDYYQFMAIFAAAYAPHDWVTPPERFLVLTGTTEQEAIRKHNAGVDARLKPWQNELKDLTQSFTTRVFEQKLAKLPEQIRNDVRKAIQTPVDKQDEVLRYLAAKFTEQLHVDPMELPGAFPEYKKKSTALEAKVAEIEKTRRPLPKAHGLTDMGPEEPPFFLLKGGEWNQRGPQVHANVPAVLRDGQAPFAAGKPQPQAKTTGRRLALARWLTRPSHPLTARVIVNRVWQHHFGTGIVATPDDFGHTGARPTHPELLDWLATEFVEQGWSLKRLHRLILTSSLYRQQSRVRRDAAAADPENKLLWRMPLRRVDAEVLRDSILAVSGQLNRAMFGPPTEVHPAPDGQIGTENALEFQRRSVYMLHRRSTPLTVLEMFDAPRMTTNCVRRRTSTVVSQALLMLNSEFLQVQAARLAERVARDAGRGFAAQLDRAYDLVLGRRPDTAEKTMGLRFLERQARGYGVKGAQSTSAAPDGRQLALADFCLVLLNSAEFLYVD
jgi:hypothetical protein